MTGPAPFHGDVAEGPERVDCRWLHAADGVRLRVAFWPGGTAGTLLLFSGRSEYCEKYGRFAGDLARLGLSTITIDWRGQGLSDRAPMDRAVGHVAAFTDYQLDVAAQLGVARQAGLAEPYFLLGHSMGGTIGLRSLLDGLPVRAAAFSAPMWGIQMRRVLRPLAWGLSWASRHTGTGHRFAPGTGPETYLEIAPFEGNNLTTDADMYAYMKRQVTRHPELALGGPGMHWLYEALAEMRALARRPSPDLPCAAWIGTEEQIVEPAPVHRRMATWPRGRLEVIAGARHEILMEAPAIRARVLDGMRALFLD